MIWHCTTFSGAETEDGNAVDLYLRRRGWRETAIARAYLEGIRDSTVSLYEVSDIRPGESFLARDLILGGEPVRVSERAATKTMAPWEHSRCALSKCAAIASWPAVCSLSSRTFRSE